MKPEDIIKIKEILPTSLGSDEIRTRFASDILRRSIFSARMESARYLASLKSVLIGVSQGVTNAASARESLLKMLESLGHSPLDGGGLKNPASIRRLNLIIDTHRQMAASVANLANESEGSVDLFPAWELTRMVSKRQPRADWQRRWNEAASSVNWEGVAKKAFPKMIALKSSPIWAALGDGAGGFRDTLGNPYPPFAFGSGLAWIDVDREECERIGLVEEGEKVKAPEMASLQPGDDDIKEALTNYDLGDFLEDLR